MKKKELWFLAQTWVKSNHVLIHCIAAPYYPFMPYDSLDSLDLEHEALLAAYQVMHELILENKKLSLMNKYYRVVFRSRCIELAQGVPIKTGVNIEQIGIDFKNPAAPGHPMQDDLDDFLIKEALQVLTNRQRQVSCWILKQEKPVSTSNVAKNYNVRRRTIQALLSNAIKRLNRLNENRRLCPAV